MSGSRIATVRVLAEVTPVNGGTLQVVDYSGRKDPQGSPVLIGGKLIIGVEIEHRYGKAKPRTSKEGE